jgi:hypothetical protein
MLSYAENTDKDIVKAGDLYYMCFQGVWFKSVDASGPWEVTGAVPKAIYEIPIDSPLHAVTYVTVEEDNDDWVEFSATPAYTGMIVAWGTAVWGNGYYYPPYVAQEGLHPAYIPRYPAYGYGAVYNPWTGTYGRGVAAYGPYGGAGAVARYNVSTGKYSRGPAAHGWLEARHSSVVYGNWRTTAVQGGDRWARSTRSTGSLTANITRAIETSQGDVYAGRDGNVYRKRGDNWEHYNNGGWNYFGPRERLTEAARLTVVQLDRESAIRAEGASRTSDLSSVRTGASPRRGSFHPRGGR